MRSGYALNDETKGNTMNKLLSVDEPKKLEYLIKKAEEIGLKDVPIPIEFAKEILIILKNGTVKRTYP